MSEFRIERLHKQVRTGFDCGVAALNRYLVQQAGQEMRRHFAVCFLLIESATESIAGYYTLSACSIPLPELPERLSNRLPHYPNVPAARMGRLAIDVRYRSRGLGGALLYDAVQRSTESDIAVYALLVDAKDDLAIRFYEHHGFQRFASQPNVLFLPIEGKSAAS